jgi:hypothetical protein
VLDLRPPQHGRGHASSPCKAPGPPSRFRNGTFDVRNERSRPLPWTSGSSKSTMDSPVAMISCSRAEAKFRLDLGKAIELVVQVHPHRDNERDRSHIAYQHLPGHNIFPLIRTITCCKFLDEIGMPAHCRSRGPRPPAASCAIRTLPTRLLQPRHSRKRRQPPWPSLPGPATSQAWRPQLPRSGDIDVAPCRRC